MIEWKSPSKLVAMPSQGTRGQMYAAIQRSDELAEKHRLAMHALCQDVVAADRKWQNELDPQRYIFPAKVVSGCLCACALIVALWRLL